MSMGRLRGALWLLALAGLAAHIASSCGDGGKGIGVACIEDSECVDNICHGGMCGAADPARLGETCGHDGECISYNCEDSRCVQGGRKLAEACRDGAECASGNCEDGACALRKAGATCGADGDCGSGMCHAGVCVPPCKTDADCGKGEHCSSDNGVRLFCFKKSYPAGIGTPCGGDGTCPSGTKCHPQWSPITPDGQSYCVAPCTSDVDCPGGFRCDADIGRCLVRGLCDSCLHDGQCGADASCVKLGAASFCLPTCSGSGYECPRYTECKQVGGGNHCVHKAGKCIGNGTQCEPCRSDDDCAKGFTCGRFSFSGERFCAASCSGGASECQSDESCYTLGGVKLCGPKYTAPALPACVGSLNPTMEVGDTIDDFAMVGYHDSEGNGYFGTDGKLAEPLELLRLSDFKDRKIILFVLSAAWCVPCLNETKQFSKWITAYGSKGLAIFQALSDGQQKGSVPTTGDLRLWLKASLAAGAAIGVDTTDASSPYNTKGSVPHNMIIDAKTLKVLAKGFSSAQTEAEIQKHLQ